MKEVSTQTTGKHADEARDVEGASTEGGAEEHGDAAQGAVTSEGGRDGTMRQHEDSGSLTRNPSRQNRCQATTKSGAPCQSFAVERGLCIAHSGRQDMAELGRRGGQSKETALRKEVRADDELRESARQVLADALAGKKNIPKSALDAARSLFSYRSDAPPTQPAEREHPGRSGFSSGHETTLAGVIQFAVDHGLAADFGERFDEAILAAAEQVRQRRGAGGTVTLLPPGGNGNEAA
jgi:hypothetical protein